MDGILVIHKEAGMTSHDVVAQLRRILHIKKIGHSGTLDPQATGVLLVLVGKACKALPYLEDTDKEYIATMRLGEKYDTDDIWGALQETREVMPIQNFDSVLQTFQGNIKQYPPMVSSVRVNGRKLYEYARNHETVERPLRDVTIYDIEALDDKKLEFRVACSSGTYIRSLCVDIAEKTGNLGCMSSLVRTKVGRFSLNDACTLDDARNGNFKLHTLMDMFAGYTQIAYEPIQDVFNGKKIKLQCDADEVMITHNQEIVAVYQRVENDVYRCARGLW